MVRRSGVAPGLGGGGGRLGAAAAAGGGLAGHGAGAIPAQVGLLRAAAGVGIRDPHDGPARFVDFLATVVANENCSSCHGETVAEMPREIMRQRAPVEYATSEAD